MDCGSKELKRNLYKSKACEDYMACVYWHICQMPEGVPIVSIVNKNETIRGKNKNKMLSFIEELLNDNIGSINKLRSFYGDKTVEELAIIVMFGFVQLVAENVDPKIEDIFLDDRCVTFGLKFCV